MPAGARFFRKGVPDAGVEGFWTLARGDEWAWQAKFFLNKPTQSQWADLSESIFRALERHPRLTRYYVCMPMDRADPRDPKKRYFMDDWLAYEQNTLELVRKKGRELAPDDCGHLQIHSRLSEERHAGRHKFWFNSDLFSANWFEKEAGREP